MSAQAFNEFTNRYKALGLLYPDPETMCLGECEGTGYYPVKVEGWLPSLISTSEVSEYEMEQWVIAHSATDVHKNEPCDGWHFIKCPDCEGTGKR